MGSPGRTLHDQGTGINHYEDMVRSFNTTRMAVVFENLNTFQDVPGIRQFAIEESINIYAGFAYQKDSG